MIDTPIEALRVDAYRVPAERPEQDGTLCWDSTEMIVVRVGAGGKEVPARRTLHLRFDDLSDPEPIPRETDYASVIESSQPVVVQHTRLDARTGELALLTTLAYGEN